MQRIKRFVTSITMIAMFGSLFGATGLSFGSTAAVASTTPETGVVYYAQDCLKQELFRNRPAPGAIMPGEKNYYQTSKEVVAVWEDGTQVLKNSIVINPDGSITLPEGYYWEAKKDDGWWASWYAGTPSSRWDDESQQWTIVYDGPIVTEKKHPDYYSQPYIGSDGEVHTPGNENYHPETEGLWGFVPPVLRPEGYVPGEPWPEPLDWSKLDELTAKADGTSWDSTTVVDRWVDGTKIYGNGVIIHPNGVYHTPEGWVDVDENGTHRSLGVVFNEAIGEWTPVYDTFRYTVNVNPPCWDDDVDPDESTPTLVEPEDGKYPEAISKAESEYRYQLGDADETNSPQDAPAPITTGAEESEPITTGEPNPVVDTLGAVSDESVGDEVVTTTTDEALSGEAQTLELG